ncbi:hypothetical protein GGD83_003860 [Rhodoblastus sphagnicola]|uniref:filamentous haemagglutinin family protein n=1 Tax=Rhodoblastus sphagnicola TaxID=333368 RepID=UPI000CEC7492|nr:filamentous haemagglutinin family protein [Rhodoblastus sphagnicola]MBB4200033.1 hypothetical protein [Rhodoblastus sphagnicola]
MLSSIDSGVVKSSAPWFSLWTANTAIDLFSAGGNLTPSTQLGETGLGNSPVDSVGATAGRFVYPSILRAVAPSGSIYLGASAVSRLNPATNFSLVLAPSPNGELEFLAGDSIYASGYTVSRSGADPAVMPTVTSPATMTNLSSLSFPLEQNLFAFGPNSASGLFELAPAKFYALAGDVVGLQTGSIVRITSAASSAIGLSDRTFYEGAGAVSIRAGRDIVSSGNYLGESSLLPSGGSAFGGTATGNLFVHNSPDDVSVVSAGRDILHSSFTVAGPGALEISAGRNLLMEGKASVTSIGAVVAGDARPGASIAMLAGASAEGPDYARLAALYLDPANRASTTTPLAGQVGKVAKTYESELLTWLKERSGFSGTVEEARAALAALPPEQQRIFLRQIYFAELRAGGREYNDPASSRYGSYLRGRQMIATLFPDRDAQGHPVARSGDITMFGGAGVSTLFGGGIQMMAPSGKVVIGVDGAEPPPTAGIVTQGRGDIQIYSQGSVLLGLSRIMTTFGGNIFAWSASGDINAGRGSKTTVLYTPPKRVYDIYGNVTLSPQAPSSGAGIATLNPIPEVKAGDIDLIAPLGAIDAGEAGIRVSGNINLAALQIVNAANIVVQGSSTGIPTVQAPSISAGLTASNATAATQQTTTPAPAANNNPSVIIVEVLGYGGGDGEQGEQPKREKRRGALATPPAGDGYNDRSAVQIAGYGVLIDAEARILTPEEREKLGQR